MGYSTTFTGELTFTSEATASQLAKLKSMLDEDCRGHPEWGATHLSYIDLEFTDDFSGLRWNGAEKSYEMVEKVNLVITQMRKTWPGWGLMGMISAQGERFDDRWTLYIGKDGWAHKQEMALKGKKIVCPHCEREFVLEDAE